MTTLSDLTPQAVGAALTYLTEDVSSADGLAKKLGATLADAEAMEVELVAQTLLARSPGFYANPRFFLTDTGLAYLALAAARAPLDPQAVLTAIKSKPSGGFYAGTRLQVYHGLMAMVALGMAVTEDGGATFVLVGA